LLDDFNLTMAKLQGLVFRGFILRHRIFNLRQKSFILRQNRFILRQKLYSKAQNGMFWV
jgi:hypothetical protein